MRYGIKCITVVLLLFMYAAKAIAGISYADMFLPERGYKPVEDVRTSQPLTLHSGDKETIPDNQLYREWCANSFANGREIYEAYREIAFDINYSAEPPKTDYWQTPLETLQSKCGDCEDSVFLFFSKLSELNIDGNIVWGWVVDKDSSVAFAHVWYQLFDKQGRPYIVEGFSKEWNGIIPVEMIIGREERLPTLMLRHGQVNNLVDKMVHVYNHSLRWELAESFEEAQFPWNIYMNNSHIIQEILYKLQDMFSRYRKQIHQEF